MNTLNRDEVDIVLAGINRQRFGEARSCGQVQEQDNTQRRRDKLDHTELN